MPSSHPIRAARVRPGGRLAVEEVPLPEPGAGEARIRVEACGICGTDLHLFHSHLMPEGHVPGHEIVGVVDALGPGDAAVREGQRVAVEPLRSCGECRECRNGRANICRRGQVIGVHTSGGLAEALAVPSERLHPVADDVAPAVAALVEPVAVAVHGLRRGRLEEGQRVLVLGSGTVGLVSLVAARSLGAGEVWCTARYPAQADRARRLGATRVLEETEASDAELAQIGLENEFDLVVETVGGRASTLRSACIAVRPGGTISVLGVFLGGVEVEPYSLLLKEGTLVWSNCYDRCAERSDFQVAVDLVEAEREPLGELTTQQLPLASIEEAFRVASDKQAGAIKVTVLPGAAADALPA